MLQGNKYTSKISGITTQIVAVQFGANKAPSIPKSIHYIDILDRSGSMYRQIDTVIDHTQERIKGMRPTDYITVIWFSSEGQYEVFLKGATPTVTIAEVLNKLRSTLNLTCFSDAIAAAGKCQKDLAALVDDTIITLLTDGHPVTRDNKKEIEKCSALVSDMRHDILAFNCIGFGNYYNRELLITLSSFSTFGALRHINDIRKYGDCYLELTEPLTGLSKDKVKITAPGAEILYFGGKMYNGNKNSALGVRSYGDNTLDLKSIDPDSNTVFFINPSHDMSITVNDEVHIVEDIHVCKASNDHMFETFLYMYADYLFNYRNKREVALDIIAKNLGDRALAELQVNAFTYDEIGEFNTLLNKNILLPSTRMSAGRCPANFVPKFDAFCLFDLLDLLQSSEALYVPFPANNSTVKAYERITRKVTDDQDIFEADDRALITSPISSIVYSEDKLNVSLKFEITGKVKLNKKSADRAQLDQVQSVKIFRNHTLVKDGTLNMPGICVIVNTETFNTLNSVRNLVVDFTDLVVDNLGSGNIYRTTLNLKKIPIINRSYLNKSSAQDLADTTISINQAEIEQKVFGFIKSEVVSRMPSLQKVGEFKTLTVDQINVLKDHGVSPSMVYSGINTQVPKVGESDFYEIKKISTAVKGFSSIPAVRDSIVKRKTPSEKAVAAVYDSTMERWDAFLKNPSVKTIESIDKEIKEVRSHISSLRNLMSAVKISVVLNNSWFNGVVLNEKGIAELPDDVVMKVQYGKEYC